MLWRILSFAALAVSSASPAFAAWHEVKSRHFIIYANEREDVLREFATRLEIFDQGVRSVQGLSDPALTDSGRIRIYVFSDFANIDSFLGIANVRGIYLPRVTGTVAFVPKIERAKGEIFELTSQTIFFHEYAHHLQLQSTAAAIPKWLIEGTAEFFSTAKIEKDGSVRFGTPANHRAYDIFTGRDLPLREMLGDTKEKLTSQQVDELYARGWLLKHYLTFEPSRRGQIDRYLALIHQGQSQLAAAEAAFGDLARLEKDLKEYQRRRRLTTLVVPPPPAGAGTIAIRPMNPGEAAIMSVRARSDRGVNFKSAVGVVADARAVAARFPTNSAVMTALAEAELDARNYEGARAAADRAIALDATSIDPLIFKARALTGSATVANVTPDWQQIRALLLRANRLDPDDPEPLMRYYLTFGVARERPSPSAVKALLYAAALVPQAKNLRFLATQQLINDKQWDAAARMFSPIAYDPHQGAESAVNAKLVMAAINAHDPDAIERALKVFSGDDDE
jgi:tetratricopeptide (TPR) repeat protein